jgi:hypothetical protein
MDNTTTKTLTQGEFLRELARPEPQDLGSIVQPILVEVRVLGPAVSR